MKLGSLQGISTLCLQLMRRKGELLIGWMSLLILSRMEDTCMYDLGYKAPDFTWRRGNLFERLDRAVRNDLWRSQYPESCVFHLQWTHFDHWPLLIGLKSFRQEQNREKPFRFQATCLTHASFMHMLKDRWRTSGNFIDNLKLLSNDLRSCNREVFENVFY